MAKLQFYSLCFIWTFMHTDHTLGYSVSREDEYIGDLDLEYYPAYINFTFDLSTLYINSSDLPVNTIHFERSYSGNDQLSVYLFEDNSTTPVFTGTTGALYKTKNGKEKLSVKKATNRSYALNGQFCLGSALITFGNDYFTLDEIQNSPFDVSRIKVTSCDNKFSHQKHVHVNQRNKRDSERHPKKGRTKRTPMETYTVELLIVVDYEAYTKWQEIFAEGDNVTLLESIKQYYSYMFNGIDLRFGSIENHPFEINMAFAGFIVAMTEEESFWTSTSIIEDDTITSPRLMINASEALEKFQVWLDDESASLPQYDHAILFTGGDLIYAGNVGNTGLAFAESMCRNISNSSIVEEAFDFRTVTYATRQIARSLGARDDMDNNDCLEFFNFIMAPKFKLPVKSFPTNRWKFSTCTVQYFTDYLTKILEDGLNCLQETSLIERYPAETIVLIQELPGTVYTAKTQCENVYGASSDICRSGMKPSDYGKLCTGLLCTITGSDQCGFILPADGTKCGNMKYCFEGQCLEFDDGEKSLDSCVFGDDPDQQCRLNISDEPYLCYTESVRYSCCASCAKVEIGLPGCEYGDKNTSCTIDSCTSDSEDMKSVCCLTCADGPVPTLPSIDDLFDTTSTVDLSTTQITIEPTTELPTEPPIESTTSGILEDTTTSAPINTADVTATTTETLITSTSEALVTERSTTVDAGSGFSELVTSSLKPVPSSTAVTETTQSPLTTTGSTPVQLTTSDSESIVTSTTTTISETTSVEPVEQTTEQVRVSSTNQEIGGIADTETTNVLTTTPDIIPTNAPSKMPVEPKPPGDVNVSPTKDTSCADKSHNEGPTQLTTAKPNRGVVTKIMMRENSKLGDVAEKGTTMPSALTGPGIREQGCAKSCSDVDQRPSTSGQGFSVYDRVYFKQLARSMRQSQRKIRQQVQNVIKQLYVSVTRQVRRHQESDTESYVYNDVVNPNVEMPSNDDDDINRVLVPVWRRYHALLLRNVERCVKQMRYKVLMMTNRHLRHK